MHYQIWIPYENDRERGLPGQSPDLLRRVGLEDHAHNFEPVVDLPDPAGADRHGRGYCWLSPISPRPVAWPLLEHVAPAVKWDGLPAGRYLVGMNGKPDPAALLKPYPWDGDLVELGDGKRWSIATPARLERQLIIQDDGSMRFEPIRTMGRYTFDVLYEQQCGQWEQRLRGGMQDADFDELYRFAVRALRINYHLTPEVVNYLGLLTESNVARVMLAAVGALFARRLDEQREGRGA